MSKLINKQLFGILAVELFPKFKKLDSTPAKCSMFY